MVSSAPSAPADRSGTGHRGRRRALAIALVVQLLTAAAFVVGTAVPAFAGPPTAMTGYVPLPSDNLVTAFKAINSAAGATLDFTVGITNAADGAVIYYDH